MALSTQPYKGARDFYPEDKRLLKYIFGVWRDVVERYGYEEYDAPLIEPIELYKAKTGDEIVNEQTYKFTDRGEREVAIRPEMTPTVSRMVAAKRQELSYPLRWYSVPNVWRYERPQKGRLREHWQLNVDLFGVATLDGEAEIIELADAIMKAFGAEPTSYQIKINSRSLTNWLFGEHLGLSGHQLHRTARLIDKKDKIADKEFRTELEQATNKAAAKDIIELLKIKSLAKLPKGAPTEEIQDLLGQLGKIGIKNAHWDIGLMRGFDYYTDIVFEVYDANSENSRSIFGGGRYDGLVGLFGVEPVPTVGFGLGEVTFADFLKTHNLLPKLTTETDIYAVLIGDIYSKAHKVIDELRGLGLKIAIDLSGRKADKQIKTAVKKGVPFALFIGEKDLQKDKFPLKDLSSKREHILSTEEVAEAVINKRP